MSEAWALLHAILADHLKSPAEAAMHLEQALALEVEPLDYCSRRFGLGDALVMERAANWAGLAFAPRIPRTEPGSAAIDRIERLGEVRSLRASLFEREVVYGAPRFAEFVRLKRYVEEKPEFRRSFCVVPEAIIRAELAASSEEALLDQARHRLFRKWPRASGHVDAPVAVRRRFAVLVVLLVLVAALAPRLFEPVFLPIVGVILLLPASLRFWAAVRRVPEPLPPPLLPDNELPNYTILVPLRDESAMVPQLSRALLAIDYPPEKLDIRFIVEARSQSTVAAVTTRLADPRFELIVVPDALPRTKPKALNYALPLITGEFLVVYDAEDIPEPGQLRLAASTFAQHPQFDCLQAELVIDNAEESWIASLFAGEYAGQFGLMLPLLAHLGWPMPLGGTSNHFRVSALRQIGGWDPYNVTEDADLGVRLARRGLKTRTIPSHTSEEAPIRFSAWLRQRTRWMKGWMLTLIVHNRDWRSLLRDLGWRGFLGFQLYVGSMVLSAPLHSAFAILLLLDLVGGRSFAGVDAWDAIAAAILIVGYAGPGLLTVAGLRRLRRNDLLAWQLALPIYWILHSVAAVRALWELIFHPFHWAKTEHGKTRIERRFLVPGRAQAE